MLPAKQSGGSTFGDRLPKPCLSCPFGLMKDRAVCPSLPTPWDAEQAGTRWGKWRRKCLPAAGAPGFSTATAGNTPGCIFDPR